MYVNDYSKFIPLGSGVLAADVVTSTGVHGEYIAMQPCRVKRIMAYVSTLIATNLVACIVTVRKRPTPNASGSQSTIGTLTIPDTTAVGKVLYKDVTPVYLAVGESVCFDVTTAGTDGSSAAGGLQYSFLADDHPDTPANESNMVASA